VTYKLKPMKELELCSYVLGFESKMNVRSGEYPEHVYCLHDGVASRVLVVDIAVEESHDDVEHWCAEAHFITGLTTEHPDPFGFHGSFVVLACLRLLLLAYPLLFDAFLQLEGRLLPVAG
jgi:hypothetical protein